MIALITVRRRAVQGVRVVWGYNPLRRMPLGTLYPLLVPVLVLLLAATARFWNLGSQSLWNDEGNSLRLAQRGAADLIDAAGRDIHPPGYYLLLKGWIGLVGESEFSLRMLSALEGLLAVAVTLALGRALYQRGAVLAAALLVALSPFAVYYSQETRMYAQLALLAATGLWVFVIWLRRRTPPQVAAGRDLAPPLALALINAAGLYTQYSYAFSLLAQGVLLAAWLVWRRFDGPARRALIEYLLLNLLTLALFLPWLPTAWDQVTAWPRTGDHLPLDERLHTVLTWITFGSTAGRVAWLRFTWPLILALAGLWPDHRRDRLPHAWRVGVPLAWGGIVIAALFASGAYRAANLKFLLPAQIAAALLMGRGVRRLWSGALLTPEGFVRPAWRTRYVRRVVAGVALFLVIIGQLNALDALYHDPQYARDDYRALAARLASDAQPADAIILDAPNQSEVFSYYYRGGTPVYPLPRGLGGDDAQTRAAVEAVIADHARIFAVLWGESERDPHGVVQAALDAGAFPLSSQWYGDVRLAVYAVQTPGPPQTLSDVRFGESIRLLGYALSAERLHPGAVLGVWLDWYAEDRIAARYKVTVQLLAPDGTLVAQHDAEPGSGRALTTTWAPGQTITDGHGLALPPDYGGHEVQVIVALYALDPPYARLPVTVGGASMGDHLALVTLPVDQG